MWGGDAFLAGKRRRTGDNTQQRKQGEGEEGGGLEAPSPHLRELRGKQGTWGNHVVTGDEVTPTLQVC